MVPVGAAKVAVVIRPLTFTLQPATPLDVERMEGVLGMNEPGGR
jgi:hypothetical protein